MQRILFWLFLIITVTTAFSINKSSSYDANFLYQTSGSSTSTTTGGSAGAVAPAMTETYVIVDGPGAGTQLSTTVDPASGKPTATASGNSTTKAEGHIGGIGVGEGMNCPGPLGHYHGTLRSKPDPDPENCGWGHVDLLSSTSTGAMGISNDYMKEVSIIDFIEKEPPDYDGAANAADEAAMELSMLQDDIRDPSKTMIGPAMAQQVSEKLGKALKDDKFIVMTLSPLPTKRDAEKDAAITLKVNNALKAKQNALMILTDAEAMAAAMAAAMGMGE